MDFAVASNLVSRKPADLLVLPFWKGKSTAEPAADFAKISSSVKGPITSRDFLAKEGEIAIVYVTGQPETRIVLLGLGDQDKISIEKLRRAYACLAKACRQKKIQEINILVPHIPALTEEGIVRGLSEGLVLTNYAYEKLKHDTIKADPSVLLTRATLIGVGKQELALAKKSSVIAEGVYLARDLVNGNADDINPQYLANLAKDFAKNLPQVKTTVFDKQRIAKEGMGLLMAVSRSSELGPTFIIIEYKGNPKSKDHSVIIGKGITYDTGGLNLKSSGMETMKCDMGGAAAVFGAIYCAAKLGMKVNLTAVVPATENAIGATSYKPGDVYKSYAGKTVEIGNTDAEGRLVLADALAYVHKNLKPTRMIDLATLTGAMEISLGAETTGLMCSNDALSDALIRAGYETYERLCRFPLYEEYRDQLKSDVADIRNIGGRAASSITAALFLQEFVGDTPWAHCDIAGTAYLSDARRYNPKHGTGVGVRLLIEFLENL